jgi:hypothetical protein
VDVVINTLVTRGAGGGATGASRMAVLEPEAGIFYGLCWIVVITRLASRRMHLKSWKRLQLDDYLIILAMVRTLQHDTGGT